MPQKLERYYGFRLSVARAIESQEYLTLRKELADIAQDLEKKSGKRFKIYVSLCEFTIKKQTLFGVGPLDQRLAVLKLNWRVRPDEQRKRTLILLNERLDPEKILVDRPTAYHATSYEVACSLDGQYVHDHGKFRILIVAAVDRCVKTWRRGTTLTAMASPTDVFAKRFRNTDGKIGTKVFYPLIRSVQLLLSLEAGKENK